MTTKIETKHTPGPWRTRLNSLSFADGVYANETWIADLDCAPTGDEREANARLIAAAPELLEALETIIKRLTPTGDDMRARRVIAIADAAIRKVRGE